MLRFALMLSLVGVCSSGCSMCCTPHYDMYPAYGGAWERTDQQHGRVGSVFEPAGARMVVAEQDSTLEEVPSPAEDETPEEREDPTRQPVPPLPEKFQPAEPALPLEARRTGDAY